MNIKKIVCGMSLLGWCLTGSAMDAGRLGRGMAVIEYDPVVARLYDAIRSHDLEQVREALARLAKVVQAVEMSLVGRTINIDGTISSIHVADVLKRALSLAIHERNLAITRYVWGWIRAERARVIQNERESNAYDYNSFGEPTVRNYLGIWVTRGNEDELVVDAMRDAVHARDIPSIDFFIALCFAADGIFRVDIDSVEILKTVLCRTLTEREDGSVLIYRLATRGVVAWQMLDEIPGVLRDRLHGQLALYEQAMGRLRGIFERLASDDSARAHASGSASASGAGEHGSDDGESKKEK